MHIPDSTSKSRLMHRPLARRSVLIGSAALGLAVPAWAGRIGAVAEDDDPHWEYDGENGPEEWGSLDESYASCSIGTAQSPIDITDASEAEFDDPVLDLAVISPLRIINNGHTVQVNVDPGSSAVIGGVEYVLKQFHFHTPSEHAIDGEHQAMELHLVFSDEAENPAVLGVLLREGEENAALAPVFANMPAEPGEEQEIDVEVDPGGFLPATTTTFRYGGSLTTPPCSEGVQWLVYVEPVEISAAQLAIFQNIHDGNARPLQPANEREVVEDQAG